MTSPAPCSISVSDKENPATTPDGSSQNSPGPGDAQAAPPQTSRSGGAATWVMRVAGFFFTILELCALGALLGAVFFPLVGPWGGLHKSREEMVLIGARSGGFFFMVWAPGVALVRGFMRAARSTHRPKRP